MFSRQLRQFQIFGFPASMLKGSAIRGFAFDVAREFYFVRGKTCFERDFGAFFFSSHGAYVDVIAERFAASFVHDADGSAYLGIWKCGDVLLQKIDEPAFSLKQREELKGRGGVGFFGFFGSWFFGQLDGFRQGLDRGRLTNLKDALCEESVEEDAEETGPGEPEASGERERGCGGHARKVTRASGMWEFVATIFQDVGGCKDFRCRANGDRCACQQS